MSNQLPMQVDISGTTTHIQLDTNNSTGMIIKNIAERAPGEIAGYAKLAYSIKVGKNKVDTNYVDNVPLKVGSGAFSKDVAHNISKLELKKLKLLPQKKLRLSLFGFWDTPHLTIINDTDKPFEKSFLFARDMYGYSIESFEKGTYGGKTVVQQGWTILTSICYALFVAIIVVVIVLVTRNTETTVKTSTNSSST